MRVHAVVHCSTGEVSEVPFTPDEEAAADSAEVVKPSRDELRIQFIDAMIDGDDKTVEEIKSAVAKP